MFLYSLQFYISQIFLVDFGVLKIGLFFNVLKEVWIYYSSFCFPPFWIDYKIMTVMPLVTEKDRTHVTDCNTHEQQSTHH